MGCPLCDQVYCPFDLGEHILSSHEAGGVAHACALFQAARGLSYPRSVVPFTFTPFYCIMPDCRGLIVFSSGRELLDHRWEMHQNELLPDELVQHVVQLLGSSRYHFNSADRQWIKWLRAVVGHADIFSTPWHNEVS